MLVGKLTKDRYPLVPDPSLQAHFIRFSWVQDDSGYRLDLRFKRSLKVRVEEGVFEPGDWGCFLIDNFNALSCEQLDQEFGNQ